MVQFVKGGDSLGVKAKTGVILDGLDPEVADAIVKTGNIYDNLFGRDAVLTSAVRPVLPPKTGEPSLHPSGRAFDVDVRDMDAETRSQVMQLMRDSLGPRFEVLFSPGGTGPNIHVELQPHFRAPVRR